MMPGRKGGASESFVSLGVKVSAGLRGSPLQKWHLRHTTVERERWAVSVCVAGALDCLPRPWLASSTARPS